MTTTTEKPVCRHHLPVPFMFNQPVAFLPCVCCLYKSMNSCIGIQKAPCHACPRMRCLCTFDEALQKPAWKSGPPGMQMTCMGRPLGRPPTNSHKFSTAKMHMPSITSAMSNKSTQCAVAACWRCLDGPSRGQTVKGAIWLRATATICL